MTAEEFEAKNINNFETYYEMAEAYAKLKCREQAESMYTSEEVKEILIRYKSDVISNHESKITESNPYKWFKEFEKEDSFNIPERNQLFKAMEYGLDYGYHMGFTDASADEPVYSDNLGYSEIFEEYLKEHEQDAK